MSRTKDPIVCRCEEIRESEIVSAVRKGAHNADAVKRMVRAGMGLCQGRTCGRLVAGIVARETGKPLSQVLPITSRPPVGPIPIGLLGEVKQP